MAPGSGANTKIIYSNVPNTLKHIVFIYENMIEHPDKIWPHERLKAGYSFLADTDLKTTCDCLRGIGQ